MKGNKKNIPLVRPAIGKEEISSVNKVLKSGWLAHGPMNKELESKITQMFKVKHCVVVNSGASALFLALKALNIKGEVLLPSMTMSATANAVVAAGARPVFCDIDERTLNIDPKEIRRKITKKTQAILPVHFAGQTCDMDAIMKIARKYNLRVIEDSAQTFGGKWNKKYAGTFGDIGCFSFWPSKGITTGEGGAVITNDAELAQYMRSLAAHGIQSNTMDRARSRKPWERDSILPGYNFRMSNIAAAIGVEQIKKLEKFNRQRRKLSTELKKLLKKSSSISFFNELPMAHHVYQMFIIRVPQSIRDDLVFRLRDNGIEASVHFDPPVHTQTFYKGRFKSTLPLTEALSKEIVTLPMFPNMTSAQVKRIAKSVHKTIEELC